MNSNESVVEEIKRRLRIEDVVSQHVALQRAGSRLKARCPFHEERTPSFFVNPALGLWKCFGCGAGGDIFSFVMKIEGLTFPEAGERLAERAGIQWRVEPGEEARARRRQLMRRANELAAQFYHDLLFSDAGRQALAYLHDRGFTAEIVRRFRLGYAPASWDTLLRTLRQKGVDESVTAEAGLAREREGGGYYDIFRHRVMFPILDVSDRVIGFGGRALDPDEPAKYINTPDTPMFRKGQHVYGLNLGRAAIVREKSVILVEGYTDVLALHQAGIENAVACLGTALTQDHLRLLSRYAEEIVLAYDADAAGMQAAARNIPMLEACPAEVRIVVLPAGLDPDECVKRDGAEGFRQVLSKRISPVEYEIEMKFAQQRGRGADGLVRAAREAVDILLRVRDRTRRDEYMARAADRWGQENPARTEAMISALRLELQRRLAERRAPSAMVRDASRDISHVTQTLARSAEAVPRGVQRAARELLAAALNDCDMALMVREALAPEDFPDEAHQALARAIYEHLGASAPYSPRDVIDSLPPDAPATALATELALETDAQWEQEVIARDIAKLKRYRATGRHREKYEIPLDGEEAKPVAVEDYEELRRRVAEKINSGTWDPDDPDIVAFRTIAAVTHGPGALGFVEARTDFAARGQQPPLSMPPEVPPMMDAGATSAGLGEEAPFDEGS